MAPRFETPLDEATGIPFPIMPRADLPPTPVGRVRNIERVADWHHPFHPRAVLISDDIGSLAVRNCRIQWAEYDDHHHKYHGAFVGPSLPVTPEEKFRTVVFAAAGYVPEQAVAFRKSGYPIFKKLNEGQRNQLWQSGQLRVANVASVRDFLLDYILAHDFSGINESTIDQFLHTTDMKRKRELGGTLLGIAAYDAAHPVKDIYKRSRNLRLLPPDQARTAGRFIFETVKAPKGTQALTALANRLAA